MTFTCFYPTLSPSSPNSYVTPAYLSYPTNQPKQQHHRLFYPYHFGIPVSEFMSVDDSSFRSFAPSPTCVEIKYCTSPCHLAPPDWVPLPTDSDGAVNASTSSKEWTPAASRILRSPITYLMWEGRKAKEGGDEVVGKESDVNRSTCNGEDGWLGGRLGDMKIITWLGTEVNQRMNEWWMRK